MCEAFIALTNKHKPTTVIFEELSFASIGNATRNLAGLYHSLIESLHSHCGIPLQDLRQVPPTVLKKFARQFLPTEQQKVGTKLTKMDKKVMVLAASFAGGDKWLEDLVMSASSVRGGKDDVADAYLMGLYYIDKLRGD